MKNNALSITSLVLVILGLVGVAVLFVFEEKIGHMDREKGAWVCFGLTTLGCILGWISFKRPIGKVSAILGTLGVLGFVSLLLSSSTPAPAPMPAQAQPAESRPTAEIGGAPAARSSPGMFSSPKTN